jgi:hypothetical protein
VLTGWRSPSRVVSSQRVRRTHYSPENMLLPVWYLAGAPSRKPESEPYSPSNRRFCGVLVLEAGRGKTTIGISYCSATTYMARATGLEPATTRSTIGASPYPQSQEPQRLVHKCCVTSALWLSPCLLHVLHVLNGNGVLLGVLLGTPQALVSNG